MSIPDPETAERARRVCELMNERLRTQTPQERDRLMQVYLAEVRGPVRNVRLMCEMTALLLQARRIKQLTEQDYVGQSDL